MTQDEKNYIASRYNDYAKCLPQHRKPEKAEAVKQLMDYFGIEELQEHRSTNYTVEGEGVSVSLTPAGAEMLDGVNSYPLPSEDDLTVMALDELEQELSRLLRWQEELRASGKPDKAAALAARIKEVKDTISDFEEDLDGD